MEPDPVSKPNSLKSLLDSCKNSSKKGNKNKTGPTKPKFDSEGKKVDQTISQTSNSNIYVKNNDNNISYNYQFQQFKGLKNFGNICYSNSVFQCLTNCKDFYKVLEALNKKIEDFENKEEDFPTILKLFQFMSFYKCNIQFYFQCQAQVKHRRI